MEVEGWAVCIRRSWGGLIAGGANVGLLETRGDMGSLEVVMVCRGGRIMEAGGDARVVLTEAAVAVAVVLEIAVVAGEDLLGPPGE